VATAATSSDGFVLHSYPYKETSLIIETFTRNCGRVPMVARGAKRNGGGKYQLNPFQPVTLSWFGRAEMKTLKSADPQRIYPQMRGHALMAGFYVNELILKLAARDDAHNALFEAYDEALSALSGLAHSDSAINVAPNRMIEVALRRFELALLNELGYGLTLDHEADSSTAIDPEGDYLYVVERGPVRVTARQEIRAIDPVALSGRTLHALAAAQFTDAATLAEAKVLMRRVINHHLGDRALHTRQLVRELK
jgi:DNA repair protein RecO (recombination protein O)